MSVVAHLWTFSISTLSRLNLGWQIAFPYPKYGRTIVVKSLGMVTLSRHVKWFLLVITSVRYGHEIVVSRQYIYISKSLSFLVSSNNCEFIWYFSLWFELPRWRLLHLALLNPSCHLFDHSTRLSRSCYRTSWSSIVLIFQNSFVSSANNFAVLLTTFVGHL